MVLHIRIRKQIFSQKFVIESITVEGILFIYRYFILFLYWFEAPVNCLYFFQK